MSAEYQPTGDLEAIPGVGPRIGQCLRDLGAGKIEDLAGRDPEEMYEALCKLRGVKMDRCVLYVFRCAAYFAGNSTHDPDLLKWWNWTDERRQTRPPPRTAPGRRGSAQ